MSDVTELPDISGDRRYSHKSQQLSYHKLEADVVEKLEAMFEVPNPLMTVNPGHVQMPPRYQELGDRILHLQVRPDDIWLVSCPRTGSTWTQEMVWLIGHDLDFEGAKEIQISRTPLLEWSAFLPQQRPESWKEELDNSVGVVDKMASPRYIKTHLPLDLLPLQIDTVKPKIVYVARNPKDMCVSFYHYCKLVHNLKGSFEDFCELFLRDQVPLGPVWNHILGFWKRRNDPNILFLKYEDMKRDQEGAIWKTAAFLAKTLSAVEVKLLKEHLSFNKMKDNPAVNWEHLIAERRGSDFLSKTDLRFIRKGQVGDWKNHMTAELAARFHAWTEAHFRDTGLTFN